MSQTKLVDRARAAAKYRPVKTRILFVAESPPKALDRYFYFEEVKSGDWLWIALMKGLFPSEWRRTKEERPRKRQWLSRFRDSGFWLVDAVKEPVSGSSRQRVALIESVAPALISEIREIGPQKVILVKATVHQGLYRELTDAGICVANEKPLPFPAAGRQSQFENGFRRLGDAGELVASTCFIAGIDGCRAGWVCFKVELPSLATSVEVVDLPTLLTQRILGIADMGIDIPIGLLDGSRACDKAARKLLGQPRGTSVFATPCRAAMAAVNHAEASTTNRRRTGRGLSQQAWGIARKIKQVDDAITPDCQEWAFEVHPEVCFWALAAQHPMTNSKKTEAGVSERLNLLRNVFPGIERHLASRPPNVGKDDLLDAAAAAWTALRRLRGEAACVCTPERDERGLECAIWY